MSQDERSVQPDHPDFLSAMRAQNAERQEQEQGETAAPPQHHTGLAPPVPARGGEEGEERQRHVPTADEYAELVEALQEAQGAIAVLDSQLAQVLAAPKVYGRVVECNTEVNPDAFEVEDICWVTDQEHPRYEKVAKITAYDRDAGEVNVVFKDGSPDCFAVGLPEKDPAQVKLLGKDDGIYALVVIGETPYEVGAIPGMDLGPGSKVKVNLQSKQIIDKSETPEDGVICMISDPLEGEPVMEVEVGGEKKRVYNGVEPEGENPVTEGDRVILDNHKRIVIGHLAADKRFCLEQECQVSWNEIGGLEEAKEAIKEAVELPFRHPETFAHYNKQPPKGVLLYGPPGCGKTLVGKATTYSLAQIYGQEAIASGFIYCKGPEILNMYVGNSEANIRALFMRGRKHYERHGFPAILFIDEAEAILSERGTSRSSDVDKTIVPMFLSEMDGLIENHILVMLATNRPKMLDPAVVREGRVDKHIKIARPNMVAATEIFNIHFRGIPVVDMEMDQMVKRAVADCFHKRRKIYQVTDKSSKEEHWFTFGDCLTGSMVKGIIDEATSLALRRDIENNTKTGVLPTDIKASIEAVYNRHMALNHKFDLEDFADTHNLSLEGCTVARVRVTPKKKEAAPAGATEAPEAKGGE